MPVNAPKKSDSKAAADRTADLLAAACRVIARSGTRNLSLKDVASEAGVSKALIHYYFESREELLARAYEFADDRARGRIGEEISAVDSAFVRLERLLALYFSDEPVLSEDWILWSELSASALFQPELRPTMEASFARWISWLTSLIQEAVAEGSLPGDTDAPEAAYRLAALVDGLGSVVMRGLVTREMARELLARGLERELLGSPNGVGQVASAIRPAAPATGYLRRLAGLTREAVGELDGLATTSDESEAIAVVRELIDKAAGGSIPVMGDGTTDSWQSARSSRRSDRPTRARR